MNISAIETASQDMDSMPDLHTNGIVCNPLVPQIKANLIKIHYPPVQGDADGPQED